MEGLQLQEKKKKDNILKKTWQRCKSFGPHSNIIAQKPNLTSPLNLPPSPSNRTMVKSKSWSTFCPPSPLSPRGEKWAGSRSSKGCSSISPKGCLSVYVGPDKQRFVIKIECTNHPLFKMLLDEAEMEYGFHCDGPLMLPCEVDMFIKILYEMDGSENGENSNNLRCSISRNRSSYHLLSPSSRLIT